MFLQSVRQWFQVNQSWIGLLNLVFLGLVCYYFFALNRKLRRYRFLSRGNDDKNLEELLTVFSEKMRTMEKSLSRLEETLITNLVNEEKHIQKCGLVRFQAFQNTGGDQSFAVALLDAKGTGIVISSLFGRDESRVYCKPVENGGSSYPLSKEEKEAIQKAASV